MIDTRQLQARLKKRCDVLRKPDRPDATVTLAGKFISNPDHALSLGHIMSVRSEPLAPRHAALVSKISVQVLALELPLFSSRLRSGTSVECQYWDPHHLYSFDSKILSSHSAKKSLEISRPKIGTAARRENLRRSLNCSFTVLDAASTDLVGREVWGVRCDYVTVENVRFKTALPLQLKDSLDIRLSLTKETKALGYVVQSSKLCEGEPRFSVTVQFATLDPEGRNRLMLFLSRCSSGTGIP